MLTGREVIEVPLAVTVADSRTLRILATASRIGEAGATLEAGELPVVMADAAQLGQVFRNLCGNAIKSRDPGRPRSGSRHGGRGR